MAWIIGCKAVEPAPTEINDLAHYFWDNFEQTSDELAPAMLNLDAAIDAGSLEDAIDGTISDLSVDQLVAIGQDHNDPQLATGVFMANVVNCSLDALEEHSYALNQAELHAGTYDAYEREYTSDFDAYTERQVDALEWRSIYDVSGLGVAYTAIIDGRMRRLSAVDDETTPYGDALLIRGVLAEPGYIEGSDNERGLMQDYQLEVFYPVSANQTAHFYVIWRQMIYTSSIDFDSESAQRLVLDGLVDWDEEAEDWCGS